MIKRTKKLRRKEKKRKIEKDKNIVVLVVTIQYTVQKFFSYKDSFLL